MLSFTNREKNIDISLLSVEWYALLFQLSRYRLESFSPPWTCSCKHYFSHFSINTITCGQSINFVRPFLFPSEFHRAEKMYWYIKSSSACVCILNFDIFHSESHLYCECRLFRISIHVWFAEYPSHSLLRHLATSDFDKTVWLQILTVESSHICVNQIWYSYEIVFELEFSFVIFLDLPRVHEIEYMYFRAFSGCIRYWLW